MIWKKPHNQSFCKDVISWHFQLISFETHGSCWQLHPIAESKRCPTDSVCFRHDNMWVSCWYRLHYLEISRTCARLLRRQLLWEEMVSIFYYLLLRKLTSLEDLFTSCWLLILWREYPLRNLPVLGSRTLISSYFHCYCKLDFE